MIVARLVRLVLVLSLTATAACRGGGTDPFATAAAGPGVVTGATSLSCPAPGPLPFVLESTAFQDPEGAQRTLDKGDPNHLILDFVGNPGDRPRLSGIATYRPGIEIQALAEEYVSLWTVIDEAWVQLGRVETDRDGAWSLEVPAAYEFDVGAHAVYAVVEGDQSCATGGIFVYPRGTRYVITDLDGTMTTDDGEIIQQIGDPSYVPQYYEAAPDLMQTYAAKGYVVFYLTARPFHLRMLSRTWLEQLEFPFAFMRTADEFVFDEAARAYKREFIHRLQSDLGFVNFAAYGNAESDIQAYGDANLDKAQTFIIGPDAGSQGTVAIAGDSWRPHLADFVANAPDADQPF